MNENMVIEFSNLNDSDNKVAVGDPVVTSYISDKYQQGILIGYISSLSTDSNNLTKSGTITPAVDFEPVSYTHLLPGTATTIWAETPWKKSMPPASAGRMRWCVRRSRAAPTRWRWL